MTSTVTIVGQLTVEERDHGFVIHGPSGDASMRSLPNDPSIVSNFVREDDSGRYRPLSGARNLPTGWTVECTNAHELADTLEAVYPLAAVHRSQAATGTLRVVSLADTLARQSGRYAMAANLSPIGQQTTAAALCGDCIRIPVWNGEAASTEAIPCPEACSVLVALCREAALWEQDAPASADENPAVGYADFDTPGNQIRERVLLGMDATSRA